MSKLMQIDHADRALANARDAETSGATVDSTAVAMAARAIVRDAKAANAEWRDQVTAGLLEVTFLEGLTVGDAKVSGIQHAITQHAPTGARTDAEGSR